MIQKLALSGQLRSGKDFIADQGGYTKLSMAGPMYKIAKYYFGTEDKEAPGMRKFLQYLGQIGWGKIDTDQYALDAVRAVLTEQIRQNGCAMAGGDYYRLNIKWKDFGKKRTFWIDIMTQVVTENLRHQPNGKFAIVNLRFPHEFDAVLDAGFQHFHVMCSQGTRIKRLTALGGIYNAAIDTEPSELMSQQMNQELPDRQIIWNDQVPIPEGRRFWTVPEFIDFTNLHSVATHVIEEILDPTGTFKAEEKIVETITTTGNRLPRSGVTWNPAKDRGFLTEE